MKITFEPEDIKAIAEGVAAILKPALSGNEWQAGRGRNLHS